MDCAALIGSRSDLVSIRHGAPTRLASRTAQPPVKHCSRPLGRLSARTSVWLWPCLCHSRGNILQSYLLCPRKSGREESASRPSLARRGPVKVAARARGRRPNERPAAAPPRRADLPGRGPLYPLARVATSVGIISEARPGIKSVIYSSIKRPNTSAYSSARLGGRGSEHRAPRVASPGPQTIPVYILKRFVRGCRGTLLLLLPPAAEGRHLGSTGPLEVMWRKI